MANIAHEEAVFQAQDGAVSPDFPTQEPQTTAVSVYSRPIPAIQFSDTLTEEEKANVLIAWGEYTGVTPVPFPPNKTRLVRGLIRHHVNIPAYIDEATGEVIPAKSFDQILMKSDDAVDDEGSPLVYAASSKQVFAFADTCIAAFGEGDWKTPHLVRCNQEERKGVDGKARRMYRWQLVRGENGK